MSWMAVGGAGVGLVGSYLQGEESGDAAGDAADAQAESAAQAARGQKKQWKRTKKYTYDARQRGHRAGNELDFLMGVDAPRMKRNEIKRRYKDKFTTFDKKGNKVVDKVGLNALADEKFAKQKEEQAARAEDPRFGLLTKQFTGDDLQDDAGYQFRLGEGEQGLNRMQAARGNYLSGAAAKQMARYNQGFASNEFANAANRFRNYQADQYGRLTDRVDAGQASTNALINQGAGTTNAIGNYQTQMGNAEAAGIMGQAEAKNQQIAGLTGAGQSMWSAYKGGF